MASVNWHKCKANTGEAGALLRHCDKDQRLLHKHSNKDIDTTLTSSNQQGKATYEQTMQQLSERLRELDQQPGANKRKDRVELLMLEIPIPAAAPQAQMVLACLEETAALVGRENLLQWYYHQDEKHQYLDHGQVKTSLNHLHIAVIPVVDGRLNARAMCSRANMVTLNKAIEARAQALDCQFLTGEQARGETVEQLKNASIIEAQREQIQVLQAQIKGLERVQDALTSVPHGYDLPSIIDTGHKGIGKRRRETVTVYRDEYDALTARAKTSWELSYIQREIAHESEIAECNYNRYEPLQRAREGLQEAENRVRTLERKVTDLQHENSRLNGVLQAIEEYFPFVREWLERRRERERERERGWSHSR